MNRLFTSVVVGLAGIQGITLAAESRPKLVVGILVDQLRTDYLDNLKDMFGTGGFRRLMESGVYLKDVDFIVPGNDSGSAASIIQTGAYPRYTGITGKMVYDPSVKGIVPVFKDSSYIGNFTDETYSPSALRVTTLTDEIAYENKGNGSIHSIAPDAAEAIVLAGHSGNSAFWINDETGRWSSTTYYPNPPASIQNLNYNSPLISRLDTMKWTPLRKGEPYLDVTQKEVKDGFKYTLSRSDRDVFSQYKDTPYLNSDITAVAGNYIKELNLGKNVESIDVLNIGYRLSPYEGASAAYDFPLQDAYLRLDKDLEQLFATLDRQVGKENVLIYLVSTGYFEEPVSDMPDSKYPGGTFSVKRSMSLLNAYLAAKYGNGAYVDQYFNGNVYLDRNSIEEKNLDLRRVTEDARDFLIRMSGVAEAYTTYDLVSPAIPRIEALRLAFDPKSSGDILLEFNPGWSVVDDSRFPSITQQNKIEAYNTPGFIMGGNISPRVIEETVEATQIAPTLARILRIRSPNSAVSKPFNIK